MGNMPKQTIFEWNGEKIKHCECGVEIWWTKPENGTGIPITKETGRRHMLTCDHSADFKKRRTGPAQGRNTIFKKRGSK